jgi:hypothetical protein
VSRLLNLLISLCSAASREKDIVSGVDSESEEAMAARAGMTSSARAWYSSKATGQQLQ